MVRLVRRLGAVGVMLTAVLAGTLIQPGTAQAAGGRCTLVRGMSLHNGVLSAFNQLECIDPERIIGKDIILERATDTTQYPAYWKWVIVEMGSGSLCHQCTNNTPTYWRMNSGTAHYLACGG